MRTRAHTHTRTHVHTHTHTHTEDVRDSWLLLCMCGSQSGPIWHRCQKWRTSYTYSHDFPGENTFSRPTFGLYKKGWCTGVMTPTGSPFLWLGACSRERQSPACASAGEPSPCSVPPEELGPVAEVVLLSEEGAGDAGFCFPRGFFASVPFELWGTIVLCKKPATSSEDISYFCGLMVNKTLHFFALPFSE